MKLGLITVAEVVTSMHVAVLAKVASFMLSAELAHSLQPCLENTCNS